MISIIVLVILTILFFIIWTVAPQKQILHYLTVLGRVIVSLLMFVWILVIGANFQHVVGSHVSHNTSYHSIHKLSRKLPIITYKILGNKGKEKVVIYQGKGKKLIHTPLNIDTHNKIVIKNNIKHPYLKTQITKKNTNPTFIKNNKVMHRVNTFYLPTSYSNLSTKQTKLLKPTIKKLAKQELSNPQMKVMQQQEISELTQQVSSKVQAKVQQKLMLMKEKDTKDNTPITTQMKQEQKIMKQSKTKVKKIVKKQALQKENQMKQQLIQKAIQVVKNK